VRSVIVAPVSSCWIAGEWLCPRTNLEPAFALNFRKAIPCRPNHLTVLKFFALTYAATFFDVAATYDLRDGQRFMRHWRTGHD